ncbi:MAG: CDP-glycerol glycerophosphotransferase, partial [Flavobacteriaceae bacterium]
TQGPSTTSVFTILANKHKYFKTIETGWSKVDPLFPIIDRPNNKTPIIMIASTFTERLSLAYNEGVYQEIKRLSKTGKYHFNMVFILKFLLKL